MTAATVIRLAPTDAWTLAMFAVAVRLGWEAGRVIALRCGWARRQWGPLQCGHCGKWTLGLRRGRTHVQTHRSEVEAEHIVAMEAARARGFRLPGDPGPQP